MTPVPVGIVKKKLSEYFCTHWWDFFKSAELGVLGPLFYLPVKSFTSEPDTKL